MKRLCVFDLDDTLLRSDKTLSGYTLDVLKRCREAGILIGVATARSEFNAEAFVRQIQPDLLISCGGALIRMQGKIIHSALISSDGVEALISGGREAAGNDVEITVDTLNHHYWNYKVDPRIRQPNWGEVIYTDYENFHEPALKVCIQLTDAQKARSIAERVPDCVCMPFSDIPWYKYARTSSTKEGALSRLCELLAVSPSDVIAFGDDFSDIGMLRFCGTGAAVANAIPEVLAAADVVVGDNNHDGPAHYLAQRFLGETPACR